MSVKKHIIFRADAATEIGYGHFMRSLALAHMLRGEFRLTFATRHPTPYQIEQMDAVCDHHVTLGDNHFDEFLTILTGNEIVVLDNYFFDTDYQRAIKAKGCRLVCITDFNTGHYVADVVVSCIGGAIEKHYQGEHYTRFFHGYRYALLRPEFLQAAVSEPRHDRNKDAVLLFFGGADPLNLTARYVELLSQIGSYEIHAVLGDRFVGTIDGGVVTHRRLSAGGIVDLMSLCGVVVVPASTVVYEAFSVGCDVVSGYFVDNQVAALDYINSLGLLTSVGDMRLTTAPQLERAMQNSGGRIDAQRRRFNGEQGANWLSIFKSL